MAQSRLDILINAKNNASGPIKQVQGDVIGLDRAAGVASKGLGGLGAAAGIAGLVALGVAVTQASGELIDMASTVEEQTSKFNVVFREYAGSTREQLAAFGDAVNRDKYELEAFAATLQDTFVPLGFARGQAADLSVELVKLATDMGSFNDINTADVMRDLQSALVGNHETLRKYGVVITETVLGQELLREGIKGGIQAATEQEKVQARLALIMAGTSDAQGDAARTSGSYANESRGLQAELHTLGVTMGDVLLPAATAVTHALRETASAINEMAAAAAERGAIRNASLLGSEILRLSDEAANAETTLAALKDAGLENSEAYRTLTASLAGTRAQLGGMQEDADLVNAVVASLADQSGQAEIAFDGLGLSAQQADAGVAAAGDDFVIATGKIEDFIRAADSAAIAKSQAAWFGVADAIDAAATSSGRLYAENLGGEAGLARQKDLTAELDAQKQKWIDQNHKIKEIDEVLLPAYIANIQDADRALFKTTDQTKALKDATSEAERAFEDLKGKVEGVLQGALDPGVGVNPDDFLPRADAINENARRLADIMVNGLKGQDWLGEFKNEVPDIYAAIAAAGDPKTAAAQALKEFEAGLRPELIDKEAAKERVRQMLLGEQNLSELAQEIAAELADEMGVLNNAGLQSTVGQALGLRGDDIAAGLSAGHEYAEGAKSAVADAAPGTVMVATLNAQLRLESNLNLIRTAGNDTGGVWGDGFLAGVRQRGVPAALIDMLVSVVLPGVQAGLNTKATLEGAAP